MKGIFYWEEESLKQVTRTAIKYVGTSSNSSLTGGHKKRKGKLTWEGRRFSSMIHEKIEGERKRRLVRTLDKKKE